MIICNDCLKELPKIKENSIDFIITDPPYNLGKDFENDNQTKEDYEKFILVWLNECYRILKENKKLIFTYSQVGLFDIKKIIEKTKFNFINRNRFKF